MRFSFILISFAIVMSGCAKVPLSGRNQMVFISDSQEKRMGDEAYADVLKKNPPLPAEDPRSKRVRVIGERLAEMAGRPDFKWEFNTLPDDKMINAFCLPGGKVAVYTGILPVAADDNQLATVMGHEIGHAIARHGAERVSQGVAAQLGGAILSAAVGSKSPAAQQTFSRAYNTGAIVGVILPFSRKHEEEADYIGVILMAKAGYDPSAAVKFWENMAKQSGGKSKEDPMSKFMSTHPSHGKRISNIQKWLPEAEKHYQSSPYRK